MNECCPSPSSQSKLADANAAGESPQAIQQGLQLRACFYREAGSDYIVENHSHNWHQLYCVLQGSVAMSFPDKEITIHAEEAVLIPPHAFRSLRGLGPSTHYLYAIFENLGLDIDSLAGQARPFSTELRPDLLALADELRRPGISDTRPLVNALLVRLLVGLSRMQTQGKPPRLSALNAAHHRELVSRVEAFMSSHLRDPITREDMAKAVNLSPPHLARVFRAATGKTLGLRLNELRLAQASLLLLDSTMPITSIALEVGFSSFSHFTQVFKRRLGISPSLYRRDGGSQRLGF